MANTLAYAQIFQQNLDTLAVQESVTGWMDANAGQVVYNGGNTAKVPKMTMNGLGNYDRAAGYDKGAVTMSYETMELTQDRGMQFLLDSQDVDETNFAVTAAAILGEFQKNYVVPEVDAYRLSKLATVAIASGSGEYSYTPAAATILAKMKTAIASVKKAGFINVPLIMHATTDSITALETAIGQGNIRSESFRAGGFDTVVEMLDGVRIIETPADRMYSAIKINTTAQGGGYEKASGAIDINFIVMPQEAPIAVNKQDKVQIWSPDEVQDADAWKINYRRYHDLWVLDNKAVGIAINAAGAKPVVSA